MPKVSVNCGADRDGVALRLALAERARRLEYEHDVRARAAGVSREPPPFDPYVLNVERECVRATDGRDYAMLPCTKPEPGRCGPDRTPPPDRCVEILRDNECSIRDGVHLDPCAHRPPTLLDIDRSASASPAGAASSARKLTSRIMKTLSLTRASQAVSCPRRPCAPTCETSGAKRAGDSEWCKTLPPPASAPPPCREPTPMEKLKHRGPGRCSKQDDGGKRCFHTSTAIQFSAPPKDYNKKDSVESNLSTRAIANAGSLKQVLKDRENLLEAGRGRFVKGMGNGKKPPKNAATGSLDIPVPQGTECVRIHVSMAGACAVVEAPDALVDNSPTQCSDRSTDNTKGKQDSWLSIKSLHKKLTSCRKADMAKLPTSPSTPSENSASPSHCAPHKKPTIPSPCTPSNKPAKSNPISAPKNPTISQPCASPKNPVPSNPCASPKKPVPPNPCAPSKRAARRENCPPCPPPKQPKRFSIPNTCDEKTPKNFVF